MKPHDHEQGNFKYSFGPFELDPQDTTLLRLLKDGQPWTIQQKQFDLLVCLLKKYPKPVSCDELIRAGWGYEPRPEDAIATESRLVNLQQQMSRLGKVIGKQRIPGHRGFYRLDENVRQEPSRKEPEGAFEDLTFQWIINASESRRIGLFFRVFIGLSLLYLLAFVLDRWLKYFSIGETDPRLVMSLIQFFVIACAFGASFSLFDQDERVFPSSPAKDRKMMEACGYADQARWDDAKQSAINSVKRYLFYWRALLTAWTLLYLVMIGKSFGFGGLASDLFSVATTLFNNFNSLAIALCFVVLDQPTIFRKDGSTTNLSRTSRQLAVSGTIAIIFFALVQCGILFLKFIGRPVGAVDDLFWALDVTSGLIGGVALALYVGRVQSKFLGPSTWLPIVLYFYVAIQSLYVAIGNDQSPIAGALIIEAALILKCLLFLYVIWLFKSGRFLFYFVRVKTIYERVNPDWKTFFLNLDRRTKS